MCDDFREPADPVLVQFQRTSTIELFSRGLAQGHSQDPGGWRDPARLGSRCRSDGLRLLGHAEGGVDSRAGPHEPAPETDGPNRELVADDELVHGPGRAAEKLGDLVRSVGGGAHDPTPNFDAVRRALGFRVAAVSAALRS